MSRIAVIGSVTVDLVVEAERHPAPGETVMGSSFTVVPGGKGANQAVAAARLGADVYMVGCVGDDPYGRMMLDVLRKEGIHTDYVKVLPDVPTGTAHITLADHDNTIVVVKSANARVDEACVDEAWQMVSQCDMILLQHEIPLATNSHIVRRAKESGIPVILNPAPFVKDPEDVLDNVTYVTPNEHEAALMYPGMATEEILKAHPSVVMTVGSEGVLYGGGAGIVKVPGFTVPVVDTTGAGDTFNGAFAVARSEGMAMDEAISFANAAAALSIGKFGAQGGMPAREDVEDMLACRK